MFHMFKKSPDPYEEKLNVLLRRGLRGEDITMMEFLETMEDLSEEPEPIPAAQEIQDAVEARKRFCADLKRFGLPIDQRFLLCQTLYEKAAEEPSPELLRLLCYILCDTGVLLDLDRDPECHSPEQDALCWRVVRKNAEKLYADLSGRKQMSAQFRALLDRTKTAPAPGTVHGNPAIENRVLDAYCHVFPKTQDTSSLRYNISALLQTADSSPDLTAVKPLFLYRALTRHKKRLESKSDFRIDYAALWKYKDYKIDDDNGKNYQTYVKYLSLFEELYRIFATETGVNAPLCLYGFTHLSNLGDFYHDYPPERQTLPLPPSIENLLLEMECMFSIYEHGAGDNILLTDSGLSYTKLNRFQCSKDRNIRNVFSRIDAYMNGNLQNILTRFVTASPDEVRALCTEILENSRLSEKERPVKQQDRQLYLAAINDGLMEGLDDNAEQYLIDACKVLIGEEIP